MPTFLDDISERDRDLFCRCRTLGKEIDYLLENIQPAAQLNALRQLLKQEIPPDARHRAHALVSRAERDQAHLAALQAEYDQLAVEAETAAERISNPNLRRFVRLFCIDGLSVRKACKLAGFCERTGERYRALLSKPLSAGNGNGRTYQAGTNR